MNYFIFSSPLQFFFATLVANELGGKCLGFYYFFGKDFTQEYVKISNVMDSKIHIVGDTSNIDFSGISPSDSFFLGNRFAPQEIEIFSKARKLKSQVNLYEEGTNTYLEHHFASSSLSDSSLSLRVKNLIKKVLNRKVTHIYLGEFDSIYTTFKFDNKNVKNNIRIKLNSKASEGNGGINRDCIFLSQSLTQDGFLSEEDYVNFVKSLLDFLLTKYSVVYFKQHPRDSIKVIQNILEDFGDRVSELPLDYNNLPVEIYLSEFSHVDVYGFFTSTLMYHSSLFGGKSFQVLSLLVSMIDTSPQLKTLHNTLFNGLWNKHRVIKVESFS